MIVLIINDDTAPNVAAIQRAYERIYNSELIAINEPTESALHRGILEDSVKRINLSQLSPRPVSRQPFYMDLPQFQRERRLDRMK